MWHNAFYVDKSGSWIKFFRSVSLAFFCCRIFLVDFIFRSFLSNSKFQSRCFRSLFFVCARQFQVTRQTASKRRIKVHTERKEKTKFICIFCTRNCWSFFFLLALCVIGKFQSKCIGSLQCVVRQRNNREPKWASEKVAKETSRKHLIRWLSSSLALSFAVEIRRFTPNRRQIVQRSKVDSTAHKMQYQWTFQCEHQTTL